LYTQVFGVHNSGDEYMAKKMLSAYEKIAAELMEKIREGKYPPGTFLPSENTLSQEYNVTRTTIRRALEVLKKQGTIESFRGKGYQVKPLYWEQSLLKFYSFGRNIAENIDNPDTKIISINKIHGLNDIKQFNNIDLWEIRRLREMDKIPLIFETSYIPIEYLPGFSGKKLDKNSLYHLLELNNIHLINAKEFLEPVLPNIETQKIMNINADLPLFQTIRYTYDKDDNLIELRESLIRGDHFRFSVEMNI